MRAGFCFNHRLARCSVDGVFVLFKKAAVEPECQGSKPSSFGEILGYPGPTGLQCLTEISSQRPKKLRTGFRRGALDKKPQHLVLSNPRPDGVVRHDMCRIYAFNSAKHNRLERPVVQIYGERWTKPPLLGA